MGGGAHVERPSPPHPPTPFLPPSLPCPFPSLPYPSPPSFPSLSPPSPPFPFLHLPLKRGVRGSSPENFEILDCCGRVLAHSCMQKGVCKCVFRSRYEIFFGPSLGGGRSPPSPPLWIRRCLHQFIEVPQVVITVTKTRSADLVSTFVVDCVKICLASTPCLRKKLDHLFLR